MHVVRSCTLKPQQICVSQHQADDFFAVCAIFELGGTCIRKHLMTGAKGNSDFLFPSALPWGTLRGSGKQNSLFKVLGPVIECLVTYF